MARALYDRIGSDYRSYRRPDPRIAAVLERAIGDARTVLNVGAGTGSYEPTDRDVVAVEPSGVMIAQRPDGAAPAVCARAEALPVASRSFDCVTALLTMHHWSDPRRGIEEMRRVSRRRIVLFTWFGFVERFWLLDYLPQLKANDEWRFLSPERLSEWLGPLRIVEVPIPHDCTDGFLCAYWRRPYAYLDAGVRGAISAFAHLAEYDAGLARLRDDLASGRWRQRYGDLLEREEMDFGYRVVIAEREAGDAADSASGPI